ncbi:MAG TPA: homoserine kinase [Clostridia bacterium]|nr:homoserine kinase [Clostridia bacterium]
MIKISVPGTTANIGPGFDCLGMALNLFLEISIERKEVGKTFKWMSDLPSIPIEKNLIYKTIESILKKNNKNINYEVRVLKNDIPISRGLGSSASAITAGVYAANYLLGNIYSENELLNIACDLEGHPDNIVPAIKGGFQISKKINNEYITSEIKAPSTLDFIVMVPDFEVNTDKARAILPDKYTKNIAYESVANTAFLVNAFNNSDFSHISIYLDDFLHQPYRIKLINNGLDILKYSKSLNAYGEFISGSGPTLISLIENNSSFVPKMTEFLQTLDDQWKIYKTNINTTGIEIEVQNG